MKTADSNGRASGDPAIDSAASEPPTAAQYAEDQRAKNQHSKNQHSDIDADIDSEASPAVKLDQSLGGLSNSPRAGQQGWFSGKVGLAVGVGLGLAVGAIAFGRQPASTVEA
ncbi:MAG: hypothetical protein ACFB5Z_10085, partial [Elainellaceae cyanobacterium]